LYRRNDIWFAPEARLQGRTTDAFVCMVEQALALGFGEIRAIGAGSGESESMGYYVLPKFGFEGKIRVRERLPKEFGHIRTILELYATPGGEEAWRIHGKDIALKFDLSPDSMSRKELWKYLHKKGKLPPGARTSKPSPGIELHLTEEEEEILRQAWEEIRRKAQLRRRRSAG